MTILKLNHPVPDVGGSLKIIASQCDSGYLDPGSGESFDYDEENIDIFAILSTIENVTNVSTP